MNVSAPPTLELADARRLAADMNRATGFWWVIYAPYARAFQAFALFQPLPGLPMFAGRGWLHSTTARELVKLMRDVEWCTWNQTPSIPGLVAAISGSTEPDSALTWRSPLNRATSFDLPAIHTPRTEQGLG
jgi:hypothetical protein